MGTFCGVGAVTEDAELIFLNEENNAMVVVPTPISAPEIACDPLSPDTSVFSRGVNKLSPTKESGLSLHPIVLR